jgi:hypothetical protein
MVLVFGQGLVGYCSIAVIAAEVGRVEGSVVGWSSTCTRGLVLGDFMRQKWAGLSSRALASVLEPDLGSMRVSNYHAMHQLVLYIYAYLDFLFAERDLFYEFLTRRLVGLWVALVRLLQDCLILSTKSSVRDYRKSWQLFASCTWSSSSFV